MGLAEVLFIVFLVLKLVGSIDWSWFWVFSPLVFTYGIILVIMLFYIILALVGVIGANSVRQSRTSNRR